MNSTPEEKKKSFFFSSFTLGRIELALRWFIYFAGQRNLSNTSPQTHNENLAAFVAWSCISPDLFNCANWPFSEKDWIVYSDKMVKSFCSPDSGLFPLRKRHSDKEINLSIRQELLAQQLFLIFGSWFSAQVLAKHLHFSTSLFWLERVGSRVIMRDFLRFLCPAGNMYYVFFWLKPNADDGSDGKKSVFLPCC